MFKSIINLLFQLNLFYHSMTSSLVWRISFPLCSWRHALYSRPRD